MKYTETRSVVSLKRLMSSRREATDFRLRKHADYQRVYRGSRKHFSKQISYFFSTPVALVDGEADKPRRGPHVGLTVPKALGKAVDRNRIKRRLRELIRRNLQLLASPTDVILHPKRSVMEMKFELLEREVISIFTAIQRQVDHDAENFSHIGPRRTVSKHELSGGRS